jgi:hypothetical protein
MKCIRLIGVFALLAVVCIPAMGYECGDISGDWGTTLTSGNDKITEKITFTAGTERETRIEGEVPVEVCKLSGKFEHGGSVDDNPSARPLPISNPLIISGTYNRDGKSGNFGIGIKWEDSKGPVSFEGSMHEMEGGKEVRSWTWIGKKLPPKVEGPEKGAEKPPCKCTDMNGVWEIETTKLDDNGRPIYSHPENKKHVINIYVDGFGRVSTDPNPSNPDPNKFPKMSSMFEKREIKYNTDIKLSGKWKESKEKEYDFLVNIGCGDPATWHEGYFGKRMSDIGINYFSGDLKGKTSSNPEFGIIGYKKEAASSQLAEAIASNDPHKIALAYLEYIKDGDIQMQLWGLRGIMSCYPGKKLDALPEDIKQGLLELKYDREFFMFVERRLM